MLPPDGACLRVCFPLGARLSLTGSRALRACCWPRWTMTALDAMCYALLNILSASGIVFANKVVFQGYEFNFPFALTFLHTVTTVGGMHAFARLGMFETKRLPVAKLVDLAAAYVG